MADAGIHVQEERADQPDVEALIRLSDEVAALLYPGEYRRPLKFKDAARIERRHLDCQNDR